MAADQNTNQIRSCLNCNAEISLANKHCQQCGQKTKSPKLTVWLIVRDFFIRVFDVDSKFFRTLLHVFVPGKLTKAYIAGERIKYYNPIRILFIAMLVHFAILGTMVNNDLAGSISMEENKRKTYQKDFVSKIDSLAPTYLNKEGVENLDSLIASLYRDSILVENAFILNNLELFGLDSLQIMESDVFNLSAEEVVKKYEITDRKQRFFLSQFLRIYKNPEGLPAFLIGNSIWTVIIILLFMSLVMKILYIRKFYYYAEHLVLLIHIHSTCFIVASLLFGLSYILNQEIAIIDHGLNMDSEYAIGAFIFSSLFMYISFMIYYKQGFIKTAIKFILFASAYSLILIGVAFMVSLLSLVFF